MSKPRREITYILRIWQEPSDAAPPGEWRGVLRSLDGRQERLFKSASELWRLLIQSEAPTDPGTMKPEDLPLKPKKD
ncbi:MAG: hypothetical protein N2117_11385 [Anaerolineales bacterium]|nr:hypothetical protein [Anaerolineales bacterium]MCX7755829.1 hypothetical protein [Anaerolineales bacterium]MDW8277476.1 hypothetical protein [Anaerolineales bacterium]